MSFAQTLAAAFALAVCSCAPLAAKAARHVGPGNKLQVEVYKVEAPASKIAVMGEVTRPGTIDLHGPTTILQALALAGGFTEAENKAVTVLRPRRGRSVVRTITFHYEDVITGEVKPFYLRSGDTVVVP